MTRVVFIDIDGVLLPRKAWLLPGNVAVEAALEAGEINTKEAAARVTFDPCAVALLNRLCERSGARLVISSNWRHTVGAKVARAKLVEQGVAEEWFHADWTVRSARSFRDPQKTYDISDWLDAHNVDRNGADWLVLDNEVLSWHAFLPQVHPSEEDGFGLSDYRVALRYLGGEDLSHGVNRRPDDKNMPTKKLAEVRLAEAHQWSQGKEGDVDVTSSRFP